MSIEHCKSCALRVDTDYDNETLNDYLICEECAEAALTHMAPELLEAAESVLETITRPAMDLLPAIERLSEAARKSRGAK